MRKECALNISEKDSDIRPLPGMSVVVPFLNEAEGIEQYCLALDEYAASVDFPIELVFVDDGSTDNTGEIISASSFRHIQGAKLITLSKNFGSHSAIRAGIMHAAYDICTWMGSDLQEPVEFLGLSYEEIRKGYNAVYIEKRSIRISQVNRGFSRIYSALMRKYAISNYSPGGISNIVFDRGIKQFLNENVESNSSIALQIMDAGYKNITISLDFKERAAGVSKWTLSKKIKLFIDSFVAFSFAPIRLVSLVGVVMFLVGLVLGIVSVVNKLANPAVPVGYSTLACIMALGFGMTNISLGIIAEYLWRAYDAARRRPTFIVSDIIDILHGETS